MVAANVSSSLSPAISNKHKGFTSSPHIAQLHYIKKQCRRLWERTKYPAYKTNYNRATRELREALKIERSAAVNSHLSTLNTHDGSLWRKTQQLTKQFEKIPLLKIGNVWLSTPEEKVQIFSEILADQFQPNPTNDVDFSNKVLNDILQPLQLSPFHQFFTPAQVKNAIQRTSKKKAPGYDLIVQPLLNAFSKRTLVSLTQIFNAILRTAHFPQQWKHAIVVPIPKPGKARSDPHNYRPISLLPLFSKLFERLLLPSLLKSLQGVIPTTQFGFRSQHSCPQQLHRIVNTILDTFEKKSVCLGLFLDTEKAFDKVWHEVLQLVRTPA